MCKVSVLIPVYNAEESLEKCLDSVIRQTLNDIEIICINDGSVDSSFSILRKCAERDSRLKIIDKPNTGYGHSMNTGIKAAMGEYIGIVESDDYVDEYMFESLYRLASEHQVKVVRSNFWDCFQGVRIFNEALCECIYDQRISPMDCMPLFHVPPAIWSAIYRREFLLENGIWFQETQGASYQDTSFHLKVLASLDSIYLVKAAYLHYRRDNPASSMHSKQKVYCIFDEFDETERFLKFRMPSNQQILRILQAVKYEHCISNYRRIAMEYKPDFLQRMAMDFQEADRKGLLRREYWKEAYWNQLRSMLDNTDDYLVEYYKKSQQDMLLSHGFLDELRKARSIYIYGAGNGAKYILRYLLKQGVSVKACVVSDVRGNAENIFGVPVLEFGKEKGNEEDFFLVAVKQKDLLGIVGKIHASGYRNVLAMGWDLMACLY